MAVFNSPTSNCFNAPCATVVLFAPNASMIAPTTASSGGGAMAGMPATAPESPPAGAAPQRQPEARWKAIAIARSKAGLRSRCWRAGPRTVMAASKRGSRSARALRKSSGFQPDTLLGRPPIPTPNDETPGKAAKPGAESRSARHLPKAPLGCRGLLWSRGERVGGSRSRRRCRDRRRRGRSRGGWRDGLRCGRRRAASGRHSRLRRSRPAGAGEESPPQPLNVENATAAATANPVRAARVHARRRRWHTWTISENASLIMALTS